MDVIWKLIGILSVGAIVWSVWVAASRIRQQVIITTGRLLVPVVAGLAIASLYVLLLGESLGSVPVWGPLVAGLAAGWAWSGTATLEKEGGFVICRRSPWTLLLWGIAFLPVQLLAVFESDLYATVGIGLLLGATGLTVGEHGGLLVRSRRLATDLQGVPA